jgi:hypothetical protein
MTSGQPSMPKADSGYQHFDPFGRQYRYHVRGTQGELIT